MMATPTGFFGLVHLACTRARDERGSFGRLWCRDALANAGLDFMPVQASLSESPKAGTLRGLHWQEEPFGENKLLQVLRGRIFDVLVDPHTRRWFARELEAGEGFLIPAGLAHGFLTLSDDVQLLYMMDRPYVPEASRGLRHDDPALAISWPVAPAIIGARDLAWPLLPSP